MILSVLRLLRGHLRGPRGHVLGFVHDLAIRRTPHRYPPVAGVLMRVGGSDVYIPAERVTRWQPDAVCLHDVPPLHAANHGGLVLLQTDLLGRRFTAPDRPRPLVARDFHLRQVDGRWSVTTVDTRRWHARTRGRRPDRLIDWAGDGQDLVGHLWRAAEQPPETWADRATHEGSG